MAKNKIERIDQEITQVREKIAEYQEKLKALEVQKTEAENDRSAILDVADVGADVGSSNIVAVGGDGLLRSVNVSAPPSRSTASSTAPRRTRYPR